MKRPTDDAALAPVPTALYGLALRIQANEEDAVIRATLSAILFCLLIMLTWFSVAIAAHGQASNCGRACLDAGVTENPTITLIGDE